ncbi:MAG: hypothetical protein HY537_03970 [Deltaproteobacteria bacterium]|nr:hypothetical protein [Deltaproteobacteria bacterium]
MASVIIVLTLLIGASVSSSVRAMAMRVRNRQVAEAYAAELLEAFRSKTGTTISDYLKKNPATGSTTALYKLCAHINILDRNASSGTNRVLLNSDPNADLGTSPLDGPTADLAANRFYSIQVINILNNPPTFESQHCNKVFGTPDDGTHYDIADDSRINERLFITVGVSWVPKGGDKMNPERLTLSTVIPER